MSSKDSAPQPSMSAASHRRRASVMLPLQTMLPVGINSSMGTPGSATTPTASVAAAASQDMQRQRRMSMNTIGLAAFGQQPPAPMWARRGSMSSSLGSDESAFDESADWQLPSPLNRRLSTGTQAFRSVRGNLPGSPNGTRLPSHARVGPARLVSPASLGREGFNFAENLRSRAERASMSGGSRPPMPMMPPTPFSLPRRTMSGMTSSTTRAEATAAPVAAPAPPAPAPAPIRPAAPVSRGLTDPIQERILKGDFYMD